ncbi:hypothetical protein [Schlesneria paludicola]|uniref:hypothetical protein n=1 Tax=Schlesneria paludicola TaxID=360056 RepID=UPI00029B0394|nr:hypothetical protein [Schlesneria paludicola]
MRQCLVLAWLLGLCSAADATDDDLEGVVRATSFRRSSFDGLKPIANNATFQLTTNVAADDQLVRFVASTQDEESGAVRRFAEAGSSQFSAPAPIDDGVVEQIFPPRAADPPRTFSTEAIPLDNAPRQFDVASEQDENKKLAANRTSFGWIAGSNDQLGMLELDFEPLSRTRFVPPNPRTFSIDTTFGAKWLNGPSTTDLPPQLFDILINLGTTHRISRRTIVDAMLSPGWYTDFSNKGIEAFRLPWHVISYSQTFDSCQTVLGVTDLARDDIHLLPVVGLIFATPESDLRLDLVFPKPRVAWRCYRGGKDEGWLYMGGELGGGSWAISRADRSYDVVTYRDYRLTTGFEARSSKGHATRVEAGWVFNRSVSYRSEIGNYSPTDSLMIRISSDY